MVMAARLRPTSALQADGGDGAGQLLQLTTRARVSPHPSSCSIHPLLEQPLPPVTIATKTPQLDTDHGRSRVLPAGIPCHPSCHPGLHYRLCPHHPRCGE